MKKLIFILCIGFLAACGGSSADNGSQTFSTPPTTQGGGQIDEQYELGKKLFNSKCNACHDLNRTVTGPPLAGIGQRRDKEWLHRYIRDNNAMRTGGDSIAIAVYKEYGGMAMNTFPDLTDEQIDAIIYYCDKPK